MPLLSDLIGQMHLSTPRTVIPPTRPRLRVFAVAFTSAAFAPLPNALLPPREHMDSGIVLVIVVSLFLCQDFDYVILFAYYFFAFIMYHFHSIQ